jgi:hypothetical protein
VRPLRRPLWQRLLVYAGFILLAWIACVVVGVGAAQVGSHVFKCHITEGGDGGCPILGGISGLALLAAFGAPLFILGLIGCLVGAVVAFIFRRKITT